jgi:hypothetical protein
LVSKKGGEKKMENQEYIIDGDGASVKVIVRNSGDKNHYCIDLTLIEEGTEILFFHASYYHKIVIQIIAIEHENDGYKVVAEGTDILEDPFRFKILCRRNQIQEFHRTGKFPSNK